MSEGRTFTAREKHACALRELRLRQHAYPRWVKAGRFTQQKSDLEIAVMTAIVADLRNLAEREDELERLL